MERPLHLSAAGRKQYWRLAGYSSTAVPLAIMVVPVTSLVPIYYSGVFLLPLATIGTMLLAARLFDVVTDPVIGVLSDRTRSSWGRRRPWLVVGTPVLLAGVWLLFVPPVAVNGAYLLLASLVTYLGWTLIQIPYWAWGSEIAADYHDRSTLSGFRETAMICGIALAALVPLFANAYGHDIDRTTMTGLAVLITVLLPLAILLSCRSFDEAPVKTQAGDSDWQHVFTILRDNRHFRRLVLAFAAIELGKGASVTVAAYFMTFYFGQSELIGLVLLLPYILIVFSVPFWLWVSRRIGKHRTVALSLALAAAILLVGVPPLSREDGYIFLAIECLVGLAAGGFAILPTALVADTADYHADLVDSPPKVATHFAAWSLVRKLMQAIAVGVTLPLLALSGFDPAKDPSAHAEVTKWMFIALSTPFYLIGVIAMWRFGLDQAAHAAIRRRLAERGLAPDIEGKMHEA